jgi:hypothetical protein
MLPKFMVGMAGGRKPETKHLPHRTALKTAIRIFALRMPKIPPRLA